MKACAKIILFGEHAVVYGKPGIAIPVFSLETEVKINDSEKFSLNTNKKLNDSQKKNLNSLVDFLFKSLELGRNVNIDINSSIPIGSGFGSSASLSVALIRSLAEHFNVDLKKEKVNSLALESEQIFHGNPSGIDNTVICFEKPVLFMQGKYSFINVGKPINLVIADTGVKSDTKTVVDEVREKYNADKEKYTKILNGIEKQTLNAKKAMETGKIEQLADAMNSNQALLEDLGVSSEEIDKLIEKSINSGALAAKLSGAGKGGNVVALVEEDSREVEKELKKMSDNVTSVEVR